MTWKTNNKHSNFEALAVMAGASFIGRVTEAGQSAVFCPLESRKRKFRVLLRNASDDRAVTLCIDLSVGF